MLTKRQVQVLARYTAVLLVALAAKRGLNLDITSITEVLTIVGLFFADHVSHHQQRKAENNTHDTP